MTQRDQFETQLEPFESPKELINGAKERISELKAMCDAVSETRNYEIITHADPNSREKIVKVRLKQRLPPKIQSLASNILKELRLALDQAFCEAAVILGRKDARGIYFPFGRDQHSDLKNSIKKNCIGVDQRLIDYCIAFKPYYGGDSDGVLWSLSSVAGTIHRRIIGAGFQDAGSFIGAVIRAKGPLQIIMNRWNSLHNELEVARLPAGAELEIESDFTLRMNIIFAGGSHALSYRPLVQTLHELGRIVEDIVSGIEAEATRIKGAAI